MADAAAQYASYITQARQSLQTDVTTQSDAIAKAAALKEQGVQAQETAAEGQKSLVQTTYGKLADEFKVEQAGETAVATETGKERIGGAKVAMAQGGVDPGSAQGSFRAPLTAEENALAINVKSIADRYGAKYETLSAQMNQDIGSIQQEIAGYQAEGDNIMADVATQQGNLVQWADSNAAAIADKMLQAQTDDEKFRLSVAQFQETQRHNSAMEGVAALRAQVYAASVANKAVNTTGWKMDVTKDPNTGAVSDVQYKDNHGTPITAATYLHGVLGHEPTVTDLANLLNSSGKSDDQQLAKYILDGSANLGSKNPTSQYVPIQTLVQKYPYIFQDNYSNYGNANSTSTSSLIDYLGSDSGS